MSPLHALHLAFLCGWGGLVVSEVVIEFALGADRIPENARLHFWIDLLAEIPVVSGVIVTGVLLAIARMPLSWLHWLKIVCAALAISANLYCAVMVVLRHRAARAGAQHGALVRLDNLVRVSGVGFLFGAV